MCFAGVSAVAETTPSPQKLAIPRVTRAPRLEDFLEGLSREAEAVVTEFRQWGPNDGAPASQDSKAYLSYDDKNLYVVWICKQDPKTLRAHLMKRDTIFNEDRVSVSLDTFHDRHRSYWFDVNAYGIQMDGVTVDGVDDINYDTVWYTDAKITADGYAVLITVPFQSIRYPDRPVQEWGIALNRLLPGSNEMSCWPYITPRIQGWSTQFATLVGLEHLTKGRNAQVIPYVMAARAKELDPDVPVYNRQTETRTGLDAKWVIQDAMSLDATINPDFSQVESDEPQVTVNQRYEVYFPEKRPFFLENANLFQTPVNLFFSRRIADPSAGLRLSGKADRWGVGLLATDDRAPGERAEADDSEHGRRTGVGVLRLFREFGTNDRAGMIYTERQIGSEYNRVGGLDTRLELDENWTLTGQGIYSDTQSQEGQRETGMAWYGSINRSGKNFWYNGTLEDYGKNFQTQLGYLPRVDIQRISQSTGYLWRPEQSLLLSYGPSIYTHETWDHQGQVQEWWVQPTFEWSFPRQTTLHVDYTEVFERYLQMTSRRHYKKVSGSTDCFPWLAFSASYGWGMGINYYPAAGLSPFLGRSRDTSAGLTLRPNSQCIIENTYLRSEFMRLPGGPDGSRTIYDNHIFRSKVNYQFTSELSLRVILDYNTLLPDASVIDLDRTKHLGVDFLLTYLLHPGTALYLGYNEGKENWAMDLSQPPPMARTNAADVMTSSQIYFKLSYLFRI